MIAPIYIIGMRGAGKTTLGNLAARATNMNCIDCDVEFQNAHQITIEQFVSQYGLERFRKKEFDLLQRLCSGIHKFPQSQWVALGGGVVDYEPSRNLLRETPGWRVCLDVSDQTLWTRLQAQPERLNVAQLDSLEKLSALTAQRRPFFKDLADCFILNDGNDPEPALKQLLTFARDCWAR